MFSKEIEVVIKKRGSKYLHVSYPNSENTFKVKINNLVREREVGETIRIRCTFEKISTGFGQWTLATPVSVEDLARIEEQERLLEIERWLGYVEERIPTYWYDKGVVKLKELGIERYPELFERLIKAKSAYNIYRIEKNLALIRASAKNGRIYKKGVEEILLLCQSNQKYSPTISQCISYKNQLQIILALLKK